MLARSRFEQFKECDILLSTLVSEGHPHIHCFYEWINPINDTSGGVYPFRTGISAVRIAIKDLLAKVRTENDPSNRITGQGAQKKKEEEKKKKVL